MTTARDRFNRVMGPAHRGLYRATNGKVGGRIAAAPVILLTGRKSGRPRTHPLVGIQDADGWVVVASNAGQHHHPAWYHNALDDPMVTVQVGRDVWSGRAAVVPEGERDGLWPRLDAAYKGYAGYRTKTRRPFPLVRLTRV